MARDLDIMIFCPSAVVLVPGEIPVSIIIIGDYCTRTMMMATNCTRTMMMATTLESDDYIFRFDIFIYRERTKGCTPYNKSRAHTHTQTFDRLKRKRERDVLYISNNKHIHTESKTTQQKTKQDKASRIMEK